MVPQTKAATDGSAKTLVAPVYSLIHAMNDSQPVVVMGSTSYMIACHSSMIMPSAT